MRERTPKSCPSTSTHATWHVNTGHPSTKINKHTRLKYIKSEMKWVKTIQNIKKNYITTKNNTGNVGIYVIYTYITWKLHIGCCWWQDTFTHFNIPETGMQLKIGSTACKFYYFVYVHDMCMKYKHACTTMHACRPYDKSRESGLSFHPRIWGGNSGRLAYTVSAFIHWEFLSARMHICCCIF